MGTGEKVITCKPNPRVRIRAEVSWLQLLHSPFPSGYSGCWPFFLVSPLWEHLASAAPGNLMPLSVVFWLQENLSFHLMFISSSSSVQPLANVSAQIAEAILPSSTLQFSRSCPWIFTRGTDTEAPVLWLPDAKSRLNGKKTLMLGKTEGRRISGQTENDMVGWHHRLNGREFEQT